ncbi:hypothetical protein AB1Y20_015930 [Prymnesium parvum]|uniref:Uncharacterized protein n=1 Tax=Prymnesium parvum TaxID=97485 RepID=A0AB34JZW9_PRYPA
MPPCVRFSIGDVVSGVAVGAFGRECARSRGANPWHSEAVRDEGIIVEKVDNKWKVKFADGEACCCRARGAEQRGDAEEQAGEDQARTLSLASDVQLSMILAPAASRRYVALSQCWCLDDDCGMDERAKRCSIHLTYP